MSELQPVDVVGIGNALVDVLSHEEDDFLDRIGVVKGGMALIDEERAAAIYDLMGPAVEISGGSVANTMVGLVSFGGSARFLSRIRDDQLGLVFAHDLRAAGVEFDVPPATDGPASGCCLIVVTPDAERTLNTFLGASAHFGPDDVDPASIAAAQVLYLEGYLFDTSEAQAAFRAAAALANDSGTLVAVSLSDGFCVERHRDAFTALIEDHVDLLFANSEEITSLYEVDDFDEAAARVRHCGTTAALTRGAAGSLIVTESDSIAVPAVAVERVVDTTGAGDLYAAGFLYGFTHDLPLGVCGQLGSIAAGEVISHIGARPMVSLRDLAADILD
ncbi:MAG: adenosine kinase [Actinobacteria bacterium]|nr:adenosine kinase [Actinomycetota bacterium]